MRAITAGSRSRNSPPQARSRWNWLAGWASALITTSTRPSQKARSNSPGGSSVTPLRSRSARPSASSSSVALAWMPEPLKPLLTTPLRRPARLVMPDSRRTITAIGAGYMSATVRSGVEPSAAASARWRATRSSWARPICRLPLATARMLNTEPAELKGTQRTSVARRRSLSASHSAAASGRKVPPAGPAPSWMSLSPKSSPGSPWVLAAALRALPRRTTASNACRAFESRFVIIRFAPSERARPGSRAAALLLPRRHRHCSR
jgi:hypothetical protein